MRTLALISTASALLHSQAPLRSSTPLGAIDITNRGYVRIDTEKETVAHPKAAPVLDEVSLRKCVDEAVQDADWHRPISVLGSTGSIGTQTLDFCRARPDRFSVIALCAGANYKLLATQVAEFLSLFLHERSLVVSGRRRKLPQLPAENAVRTRMGTKTRAVAAVVATAAEEADPSSRSGSSTLSSWMTPLIPAPSPCSPFRSSCGSRARWA